MLSHLKINFLHCVFVIIFAFDPSVALTWWYPARTKLQRATKGQLDLSTFFLPCPCVMGMWQSKVICSLHTGCCLVFQFQPLSIHEKYLTRDCRNNTAVSLQSCPLHRLTADCRAHCSCQISPFDHITSDSDQSKVRVPNLWRATKWSSQNGT